MASSDGSQWRDSACATMSAASRSPPSFRKLAAAAPRDPRQRALGVGQPAPVAAQPLRVRRQRLQRVGVRGGADQVAFLGAVDLALDQLVDQRGDLGVAAGGAQRPQLQPQRGGVRAGLLAQRGQVGQRLGRAPLLELHLGLEHQPRHREAVHLRVRAREQRRGAVEIARFHRRARRRSARAARRSAESPAPRRRTAAPCHSVLRAAPPSPRPASPARAPASAGGAPRARPPAAPARGAPAAPSCSRA